MKMAEIIIVIVLVIGGFVGGGFVGYNVAPKTIINNQYQTVNTENNITTTQQSEVKAFQGQVQITALTERSITNINVNLTGITNLSIIIKTNLQNTTSTTNTRTNQ